MRGRLLITAATVVFVGASLTTAVRAKDGDKDNNKAAVMDAVVDFGQPQPQGTPPSSTHFLQPVGGQPDGTTTIFRGGTVTFRVNGGGHGVSVYPVTRDTTRDNILAAMCPNRSAIIPDGGGTDQSCGADFLNGPHTIKDSEGNVLLEIGTNPPFARVDDPEHIMIGADALIQTGVDANGVPIFAVPPFHQGTTAPGVTPARPIAEQIRVSFPKKGRYLAICMNRAHSFNDWMFAFIDVVGSDGDQ